LPSSYYDPTANNNSIAYHDPITYHYSTPYDYPRAPNNDSTTDNH